MKTRWTIVLMGAVSMIMCSTVRAQDADLRPTDDPFKPLVEMPLPPEPPRDPVGPVIIPPPARPVVAPVDFVVQAIASDQAQKVAVIEFQGQIHIVQEGMSIPDATSPAFTVKKVTDTRVEVFDPRVGRLVVKQIVDR